MTYRADSITNIVQVNEVEPGQVSSFVYLNSLQANASTLRRAMMGKHQGIWTPCVQYVSVDYDGAMRRDEDLAVVLGQSVIDGRRLAPNEKLTSILDITCPKDQKELEVTLASITNIPWRFPDTTLTMLLRGERLRITVITGWGTPEWHANYHAVFCIVPRPIKYSKSDGSYVVLKEEERSNANAHLMECRLVGSLSLQTVIEQALGKMINATQEQNQKDVFYGAVPPNLSAQ